MAGSLRHDPPLPGRLRRATRAWLRRRQGPDRGRLILGQGRIYILPTTLGVTFAVMLLGMLLGSLNYANNLGLALTFALAGIGLVSMHACHRNLVGLAITPLGGEPTFAGEIAIFRFRVENDQRQPRIDLEVGLDGSEARGTSLDAMDAGMLQLKVPSTRRGRLRLTRCEVATRYPFGLFRAWAVLHPEVDCIIYPQPAANAPPLPEGGEGRGTRQVRSGDDDFAALRDYRPGDTPGRVAWKALARSDKLLVRQFESGQAAERVLDLDSAPGATLEQRLEVLARWIIEAQAAGGPYTLKLGDSLQSGSGERHREACLTRLADFQAPEVDLAS